MQLGYNVEYVPILLDVVHVRWCDTVLALSPCFNWTPIDGVYCSRFLLEYTVIMLIQDDNGQNGVSHYYVER